MNQEKLIYTLTVEDLQTVAADCLERELTEKEISLLEEKIGDYIDWYSIIEEAINNNITDKR